ncbi:MAG TPA: hypothetical protein VF649_13175 [Sphingomonas sp.]|jgi:predicted transcriptional regulator
MGKMNDIRTQVDDAMMVDLDRLAKSMDRSHESLLYYALERLLDEAAERAFIQEGIDSAENEPMIPHKQMVLEIEAMITAHRARCVG